MAAPKAKAPLDDNIFDLPWATIVNLIAVIAVSIVFVANDGQLPDDAATFFALVLGGNGLTAIGRGFAARKPG